MIDALEKDPLSRTEVRLYQPYQSFSELSSSLSVVSRDSGLCSVEQSHGDFGSLNANRCYGEQNIYDPCFAFLAVVNGESVACPASPWAMHVVSFTATKLDRLPNFTSPDRVVIESNRKKALPWALELSNGKGCLFAQGATGDVAGRRLNYQCFEKTDGEVPWGEPAGYVVGDLDRTESVWRVQFSATDSTAFHEVTVERVWY
jgi:hypothetical protein